MSLRRDALEQVPDSIDDRLIPFGKHKGLPMKDLPADYVRWLADPARETVPEGGALRPLHPSLTAWARNRIAEIDAEAERELFARRALGGFPTALDAPIYVIEADGDCHSHSGQYAIDYRWFHSLDEALAFLATEYPIEERTPGFDADASPEMLRTTPDPEDDRILVWEVQPSGHRRAVWGCFGWHWDQSVYACGQGTLPGDSGTLYELACRDL